MDFYIFLTLAVISVITALLMVFARNPVHSVLYLILTFFAIAGQYVMLNAQFLAVVHIIVYAGAIMVLFLFVLMLLNLNKDSEPKKSNLWKISGAITSGMLLVVMVGALRNQIQLPAAAEYQPDRGLPAVLGRMLFDSEFVVPFEITGILFLAAMVGAVLVGKREIKV